MNLVSTIFNLGDRVKAIFRRIVSRAQSSFKKAKTRKRIERELTDTIQEMKGKSPRAPRRGRATNGITVASRRKPPPPANESDVADGNERIRTAK